MYKCECTQQQALIATPTAPTATSPTTPLAPTISTGTNHQQQQQQQWYVTKVWLATREETTTVEAPTSVISKSTMTLIINNKQN
jgi:hypothetical protein